MTPTREAGPMSPRTPRSTTRRATRAFGVALMTATLTLSVAACSDDGSGSGGSGSGSSK
jgi:hypothetical protein